MTIRCASESGRACGVTEPSSRELSRFGRSVERLLGRVNGYRGDLVIQLEMQFLLGVQEVPSSNLGGPTNSSNQTHEEAIFCCDIGDASPFLQSGLVDA